MTADLWARWRATYEPPQAKRLVEDGFCDEKMIYRSAPVRLLVVLKENG